MRNVLLTSHVKDLPARESMGQRPEQNALIRVTQRTSLLGCPRSDALNKIVLLKSHVWDFPARESKG